MKLQQYLLKGFFALTLTLSSSLAFAQKGTLDDLRILDGRWLGTFNGGPIEAAWSAPMGNSIIGYLRIIKDDQPAMYEIFSFEQKENGPVVRVKHFSKGLISIQNTKEEADTYNFVEATKNSALFEKVDGQVRINYVLRKKDLFILQKGTLKDGKWEFVDLFTFKRIKK